MQLDNETLDILKNFSTINPSLMVKVGNTIKTISLTQTVIAKAKLKQEFTSNFAIYDLSNFISAMSMFSSTELNFEDERFVVLSNAEKTAMVHYFFADPSTIIKPPEREMTIAETKVKFQLTKAALADIIKAVSVLSLPELAVVGDGKQISVQAVDSKNPSSNLYKQVIGDSSAEFNVYFKIENIKMLPIDYNVSISSPKSKQGVGIAHFASPDVEYWIAIEQHSSL